MIRYEKFNYGNTEAVQSTTLKIKMAKHSVLSVFLYLPNLEDLTTDDELDFYGYKLMRENYNLLSECHFNGNKSVTATAIGDRYVHERQSNHQLVNAVALFRKSEDKCELYKVVKLPQEEYLTNGKSVSVSLSINCKCTDLANEVKYPALYKKHDGRVVVTLGIVTPADERTNDMKHKYIAMIENSPHTQHVYLDQEMNLEYVTDGGEDMVLYRDIETAEVFIKEVSEFFGLLDPFKNPEASQIHMYELLSI